jgi:MFS family permease
VGGVKTKLTEDFWVYLSGQAVSGFGSSFTQFAIPLLVLRLTGSATSLGLTVALTYLPYMFFGLLIGAITDRVDRRRMMMLVDLTRCGTILVPPLLYLAGDLHVQVLYAVAFLHSVLRIFFDSGQFAAVTFLAPSQWLAVANSRIQGALAAANVLGPVLAGAMVAVLPVVTLLVVDGATFLVSVLCLAVIRRSFGRPNPDRARTVRSLIVDVRDGVRFVWTSPALRQISIMMAVVNLFNITTIAQLPLLADHQLHANNSQIGWLYAAGGAGVLGLSALAGPLRRRGHFAVVVFSLLLVKGFAIAALGFFTSYPLALLFWAMSNGAGVLLNINTTTLRQEIVPPALLGRVISVASVLAWSAMPLGALTGGAITGVGGVGPVYVGIGVLTAVITLAFAASSLRHVNWPVKTASTRGELPT